MCTHPFNSFHRLCWNDFNNQWSVIHQVAAWTIQSLKEFMPFLRFPSSRVLQRFHFWTLATKVGMYLPRLNYTEAKYPHVTMKLWNIDEDACYDRKGSGCWKVQGMWVDIELLKQLVQLVVASCASSCWRHWSPYYRPLGNIGEHIFSLLMNWSGGSQKTQLKNTFPKNIKR